MKTARITIQKVADRPMLALIGEEIAMTVNGQLSWRFHVPLEKSVKQERTGPVYFQIIARKISAVDNKSRQRILANDYKGISSDQ